ncbi:hypothetical protein LUZ61_017096 [Rhynchospora tenuis]|uniref:Cysteine-rich receptor-like protein kinase 10 n=1 Tax=Rhynchospora tenuis TaxID=198213 RepID=A0AAD6EKN4_9POAL|nr:hypothetical protein LUZ61_017096 [Rhynchospora tenuis]
MHFSIGFLLFLFYLTVPANADQPFHSEDYFYYICDSISTSTGNYTTNSTYQSNLNQLFLALDSNSTSNGFAAGTSGTVPDKVTGIVLCRGDLNASTCSACFSQSFHDILNFCPYYKTALMWYNKCYMYFSSKYFLSSVANSPQVSLMNYYNVTVDPARFDHAVAQLMSQMKSWAINNSTKFFATGEVTNFSTEFTTIYGLVQCTPDMTKSQCQSCLEDLIDHFFEHASGKIGARTIGIHCNIRYETYPFYEGPSMVQIDSTIPSQSAAPTPRPVSVLTPAINKENDNPKTNIENVDSFLIDLSTLKEATLNFNESNKLGEGGFGAVYKGILPNGQEIAVKRLSQNSGQGVKELKNELVLVAKLQHKNLVQVVGVCLEGQEKLLAYEFVPNRSLGTFLFDNERRQELDWRKRKRIINGVARGLQYMHEDCQLTIVHRDLKASNILLGSDMNPKISDFGLARLFQVDQTAHATSRVVGTYGYMAPEYAMHGLYSIKSDVFSFGVLLLEILTGRRNSAVDGEHGEDILSSTWEHWVAGTITDTMDPQLDCPTNEVIRHVQIGLLCVQEDPINRPSMSEVVIMLSSNTISLEAPSKPALYLRRGGSSISQSLSGGRSLQMSQNDISTAQLGAR